MCKKFSFSEADDPRLFKNRLRYVLEDRHIGHKEFSGKVGIKRAFLKECLSGQQTPAKKKMRRMAEELNIPLQWLEGEGDAPPTFNDKLRYTLTERNISTGKLAALAHMSREKVALYIVGEALPTIEELRKIAEVLEVSPQWLAGNM